MEVHQHVQVLDHDGERMPSRTLANSQGRLVLQVDDATSSETLYVQVRSATDVAPYE